MGSIRAWGTYSYMVSKYFTVLLINKTKFPNPCHALKNSVAVKRLIIMAFYSLYITTKTECSTYNCAWTCCIGNKVFEKPCYSDNFHSTEV